MAEPKAPSKPRIEPKIVTGKIDGFTPPEKPQRVGNSKYPFDDLGIGEFFSVMNKTRNQMVGPVNTANRKHRTEATNAAGEKQTIQQREFYAVEPDAEQAKGLKGSKHDGAKVLVIRSK